MSDVVIRDDAPLSASKRVDAVRDVTEQLIETKGDSIVGWAVTISRSVHELFTYFRHFANLPNFMENVERVEVIDGRRSR